MLSIVTRVRILFYEGKRLALRDGESNPGLPRAASTDDRRGYLPLYYHGFAVLIRYGFCLVFILANLLEMLEHLLKL